MVAAKQPWANRIIGHGLEKPDQLLANPWQWKIHPNQQKDAIAGVLSEVGWVQSVIVNQRTQHLVDGHARVAIAISRNESTIPVVYVDLSEEEERLVLSVLDPLSALATTDKAKLDELLREVSTSDANVQQMLSKLAADSGLYKFDPSAEWRGMPEFEQEDLTAYQSIHVNFKCIEDIESFAQLIGQKLTDKTRSIWYPQAEKIDMSNELYRDES